jgi:hypothetical protein
MPEMIDAGVDEEATIENPAHEEQIVHARS